MKYNFGWGEPYCVREALQMYYSNKSFMPINLETMGYQGDIGQDRLVYLTKNFIKATTGISYKHVIITNGTTGALNVVLRKMVKDGKKVCYTHQYHFPYYPGILNKYPLEHKKGLYLNHESELADKNTFAIVDSPTNPEGNLVLYTDTYKNIIWDSVYHSAVFINDVAVKPDHFVNCGSYSKVFGLTGVRVGWIATDNDEDFEIFKMDNLYENCTLSMQPQSLITDILDKTDIPQFMLSAKYRINNNREMFSRIENLFDGQPVPNNGMFYVAWASVKTQQILDKMSVNVVQLDSEGNDRLLRFNLAQYNSLTSEFVRNVLKEDISVRPKRF